MSTIFISIMANLFPRQLLGPSLKGRNDIGCLPSEAEENLVGESEGKQIRDLVKYNIQYGQ